MKELVREEMCRRLPARPAARGRRRRRRRLAPSKGLTLPPQLNFFTLRVATSSGWPSSSARSAGPSRPPASRCTVSSSCRTASCSRSTGRSTTSASSVHAPRASVDSRSASTSGAARRRLRARGGLSRRRRTGDPRAARLGARLQRYQLPRPRGEHLGRRLEARLARRRAGSSGLRARGKTCDNVPSAANAADRGLGARGCLGSRRLDGSATQPTRQADAGSRSRSCVSGRRATARSAASASQRTASRTRDLQAQQGRRPGQEPPVGGERQRRHALLEGLRVRQRAGPFRIVREPDHDHEGAGASCRLPSGGLERTKPVKGGLQIDLGAQGTRVVSAKLHKRGSTLDYSHSWCNAGKPPA